MNLTAKKRTKGKSIGQIRRDGGIPAVFYSPGDSGHSIEVNGPQFEAALRSIKPGRLATTKFTLDLDGKKIQAIVKDIQYNRTTYQVLHLDFEELKKDVPVRVNVPIECVGQEECVGIKLGGFSRQIIRSVRIKCLPQDIPEDFKVDISNLNIKQSLRVSALQMPKGVQPLATTDEVVVVIAKKP
ncbi:MAG: 50S ribosomal protein L25/general stress protein Ctc [Verrucomicrobia bacterium]|nr:50S ribosomal protein L25/general stress protein Ctc [Verrucomicrobiota bacterium]